MDDPTSYLVVIGISCLFIALMICLWCRMSSQQEDDWDTMESGTAPIEDVIETKEDSQERPIKLGKDTLISPPSPVLYKKSILKPS